MKTKNQSQVVPEGRRADSLVLTSGRRVTRSHDGVIAVLVEGSDGTCSLFCRGSGGSWPSVDEAKNVVEKVSPWVVWRETTPGVWTGRSDANEPQVLDCRSGRGQRTEPANTTRPSSVADTYLAARVLRGITHSGRSRSEAPVCLEP